MIRDLVCAQDRKCQAAECQRMPNFNFPGEKGGVFCSQHKVPSLAWPHLFRQKAFQFAKSCLDHIVQYSKASFDSLLL